MADHQVTRDLRTVTKGRVAWSLVQRADDVRRAHPVWRDTQIDQLEVSAAGESLMASSLAEVEEWVAHRPVIALTSISVRWTPGGQVAAPGVPNRIALRLDQRAPTLWVGHTDDTASKLKRSRTGSPTAAARAPSPMRRERLSLTPNG